MAHYFHCKANFLQATCVIQEGKIILNKLNDDISSQEHFSRKKKDNKELKEYCMVLDYSWMMLSLKSYQFVFSNMCPKWCYFDKNKLPLNRKKGCFHTQPQLSLARLSSPIHLSVFLNRHFQALEIMSL